MSKLLLMRRYIFYCSVSFLLALVILYFNTTYPKLDGNRQNFSSAPFRTINTIPSVVIFQSRLKVAANCSNDFYVGDIRIHQHGKWQTVGTDPEWYIYSAYLDRRMEKSFVRIIAMTKGYAKEKLFCRIWHNSSISFVSEIRKQELWIRGWDSADPGKYYKPFLLSCPIQSDLVVAVSIIDKHCEQPRNLFNTSFVPSDGKISKDFVVCLKPLDSSDDISYRLVEWLQLQYLLGADKIAAYVYTVHPQTWKVLKHYEKAGKMSIHIHGLPEVKDVLSKHPGKQLKSNDVWQKRRHEMAVYNDCFYRHIHSHRYVVNLDLDEEIVPLLHDSWLALLENASIADPSLRNSASISIRNVYFFDSFGEVNDSEIPDYMHMLRHVYRSANFTPPGFAQKSFFSTNLTSMVSNHFSLQALRPGIKILSSIAINLAHLHHYRKDCPPLMEKDCEDNFMKYRQRDTSIWRFKERLIASVREKLKENGLQT